MYSLSSSSSSSSFLSRSDSPVSSGDPAGNLFGMSWARGHFAPAASSGRARDGKRKRERKRSRTVRTKPLLLSLRLLDAAGNKSIDPKPECEQCVESADWTTLLRTWGGKRVEIFVSIKSKGGNGWTHRSHCWCWAIKKKGPSARRFILTRRWESARLLLMPRPRVLLPA